MMHECKEKYEWKRLLDKWMSVVSRLGLKWEIFYIFLVLETWYEEICLPDCHNLRTLILKRLLWDLKLELGNKT